MKREPPKPPRPEYIRRPSRGFGWLDARLLHERRLGLLGPERVAALTLLALAADRTGSSFYRRETMALTLSMQRADLDEALDRLLDLDLIAHRPWHNGEIDGVWQILPCRLDATDPQLRRRPPFMPGGGVQRHGEADRLRPTRWWSSPELYGNASPSTTSRRRRRGSEVASWRAT